METALKNSDGASCIFCKIIKKEIPTEFILEEDDVLAFDDINPKAPVHILVIPKKHIESVSDLDSENAGVAERLILGAKKIAEGKKLSGYKLVFNVGQEGGQIISHIHLHLLGGWPSSPGKLEV